MLNWLLCFCFFRSNTFEKGGCLLPSRAFSYKQCHKSTRAHNFCLIFSCSHARKSFQAQLTMAILPAHKNSIGIRDSPRLQVCLQCLSRRLTTSVGEGCPLKAYILYAFEFWFVCSICFNKGTSLWLIRDWRLQQVRLNLNKLTPMTLYLASRILDSLSRSSLGICAISLPILEQC
jgi:hypothetical protein